VGYGRLRRAGPALTTSRKPRWNGLGPLHTQFDNQGYGYTSLFLDSAVARWSLGGDFADKHPEEPWQLVSKTSVHYNIGHLVTAEGDTISPDGQFLWR
jgi:nitrous-oxide reductase